jgi:hypothetical protein
LLALGDNCLSSWGLEERETAACALYYVQIVQYQIVLMWHLPSFFGPFPQHYATLNYLAASESSVGPRISGYSYSWSWINQGVIEKSRLSWLHLLD